MVDDINTKTNRDALLKEINDLAFFGPVGEFESKLKSKLSDSDQDELLPMLDILIKRCSRLREIINSSFKKIDDLERNSNNRSLDRRSLNV